MEEYLHENVKLTDEERYAKVMRLLRQAAAANHPNQLVPIADELLAWVKAEREQSRSVLGTQIEAVVAEFGDQIPLVFRCIEQTIHGDGEREAQR